MIQLTKDQNSYIHEAQIMRVHKKLQAQPPKGNTMKEGIQNKRICYHEQESQPQLSFKTPK
jgi:hypothetical protein